MMLVRICRRSMLTYEGNICPTAHTDKDPFRPIARDIDEGAICSIRKLVRVLDAALGYVAPDAIRASGLTAAKTLHPVI